MAGNYPYFSNGVHLFFWSESRPETHSYMCYTRFMKTPRVWMGGSSQEGNGCHHCNSSLHGIESCAPIFSTVFAAAWFARLTAARMSNLDMGETTSNAY